VWIKKEVNICLPAHVRTVNNPIGSQNPREFPWRSLNGPKKRQQKKVGKKRSGKNSTKFVAPIDAQQQES